MQDACHDAANIDGQTVRPWRQQTRSPECAATELLRHCETCRELCVSWIVTFRHLPTLTAQCNLHTHCLSSTGGRGPCHRIPFVMWSERRSEACSWCVDVGLRCGVRLDPSLTDYLAGLEALFRRCATHDCVIVWRDVDESVTSVDYTFHVHYVVSLEPLGLLWINLLTYLHL